MSIVAVKVNKESIVIAGDSQTNWGGHKFNKKDTTSIMQTLAVGLDVNITKKWKISVSSGFDISNKSITRTDISIIRDLHCWQMEFKWTPVGFQQGFYMTIYVTSQQFNWLKLQKQKGFFDTGIFGGLGSGGMGALGGLGNLGSGF